MHAIHSALGDSRSRHHDKDPRFSELNSPPKADRQLFHYLRPEAAPYHVRAVELLWNCNELAEAHTLENVVARRMASSLGKLEAFEAFGVLWNLTGETFSAGDTLTPDDSLLPGEIFNTPVCAVLEAMRGTDLEMQRIAETWMRCHSRSYFR